MLVFRKILRTCQMNDPKVDYSGVFMTHQTFMLELRAFNCFCKKFRHKCLIADPDAVFE